MTDDNTGQLFRQFLSTMPKQQWLTVGISTFIASVIAAVLLPSKPAVTVIAGTAGAVGGLAATNTQQSKHRRSPINIGSTIDSTESEIVQEALLEEVHSDLRKAKESVGAIEGIPYEVVGIVENTVDSLIRLERALVQNNEELLTLKTQLGEAITSEREKKKVAIFYDIENLLKGYNFSRTTIINLSLKDVISAIQSTGHIGHISIQKAYANWSDPRLRVMRHEINELGIDPVQVFGFSREPTKNAADIQLVIDAVNLVNSRPSIDVFAIVSGDGGFASLAKQLHEFGKIVIGCAYEGSTSRTFQSVCDDFVWIADPELSSVYQTIEKPTLVKKQSREGVADSDQPNPKQEDSSPLDSDQQSLNQSESGYGSSNSSTIQEVSSKERTIVPVSPTPPLGLDPRNARLVTQIESRDTSSMENTVDLTRDVLNWYAKDSTSRTDLLKTGIYLSVVEQAISYVIPGLQTIELGFPKFIEYMQYVCTDSELCIVRVPPSKVVLALRESLPNEAQVLPDLAIRDIHSVETYRSILETGSPMYRLASPQELHAIATWVLAQETQQKSFGKLIEDITTGLDGAVSSDVVKNTIFSLLAAGVFSRGTERGPMAEQKLTLRKEITSLEIVLCILKIGATQKLASELPYVNETILNQILPDIA